MIIFLFYSDTHGVVTENYYHTSADPKRGHDGLKPGATAGISIAVTLVVGIIIIIVVISNRRRRQKRSKSILPEGKATYQSIGEPGESLLG